MAHRRLRFDFRDQRHRLHLDSKASDAQWTHFRPVASQLIATYAAFYNRSHHRPSAERWEALRVQGYKPAKRSVLDRRWWDEERRRGRVQPDHQLSLPLRPRRPPRQPRIPPDKRSFSSASVHPQLASLGSPLSPPMLRKNSPDVLDLVGRAIDFGAPDFDHGGPDSTSDGSSTWTASVGKSPGSKGLSGLQPGSFIELRRSAEPCLFPSFVTHLGIYTGPSNGAPDTISFSSSSI